MPLDRDHFFRELGPLHAIITSSVNCVLCMQSSLPPWTGFYARDHHFLRELIPLEVLKSISSVNWVLCKWSTTSSVNGILCKWSCPLPPWTKSSASDYVHFLHELGLLQVVTSTSSVNWVFCKWSPLSWTGYSASDHHFFRELGLPQVITSTSSVNWVLCK